MFNSLLKKFLIAHLIITTVALSQTYIAVIEFTGKNVSAIEASALTDRLRSELFRTGQFRVIEREMMNDILAEQGFQMSGCTTEECIVEMGRLIGVDQIISGSVSRVGDVFSIAARTVDVETAEIVQIATYDHEGKIGELLKTGMGLVARELARDVVQPESEIAMTVQPEPVKQEEVATKPEVIRPAPSLSKPVKSKSKKKSGIGIIGGFGTSVPYGLNVDYDYEVGGAVMLGAYGKIYMGSICLRPEIVIIDKGHTWHPSDLNFITRISNITINAIYQYELPRINLLVGLSSGFIISGTVTDEDDEEEYDISDDRDMFWPADQLASVESSFIIGAEFQLDQFLIGLRFLVGTNEVYLESWDSSESLKYYTSIFTFGYQF